MLRIIFETLSGIVAESESANSLFFIEKRNAKINGVITAVAIKAPIKRNASSNNEEIKAPKAISEVVNNGRIMQRTGRETAIPVRRYRKFLDFPSFADSLTLLNGRSRFSTEPEKVFTITFKT